jgi:serine/threonine protein kinase/tetratricopeptide (TPR) repeat protein
MVCPRCGSSSPAVQGKCPICGFSTPSETQTTGSGQLADMVSAPSAASMGTGGVITGGDVGPAETPTGGFAVATGSSTGPLDAQTATADASARVNSTPLNVGTDFGSRYHIIKLLGVGGMGAVYQAWDKTLEVAVAVKVIRPLASMDAQEAQAVEKRFKRELLLARSVTHKNVVRIHDLGEIDGTTYITMPYVQGSDLWSILKREGRLPVHRTLAIMKQVGAGLAAAHKAGVVHRDLKPANIMVDSDDEALIMDFGIARSTEAGATMTVGGAVIGTIEYMAPEQAKGEAVDARADIYAFGLMLNDLLLGRRQGVASTPMASLLARMHAPPPSIRSVDPALPESLDAIVTKCVQPDPAARYPQTSDVLADLEQLDDNGYPRVGTTVSATISAPVQAPAAKGLRRGTLSLVAGLLVAVAVAGWFWRDSLFNTAPSAPVGPPVSLAILPFRNASGDPTLDSLGSNLSQELSAELGQSSRVRTVPTERIRQVLKDLHFAPAAEWQPADLANIADFTNARRVLSGDVSRLGDGIRINATLQNLDTGQPTPLTAAAPNQGALLAAVAELTDKVRQELGRESRDIAQDLQSTAWKPSTSSFDALNLYNEGLALAQQGQHQDAQKRFQAAADKDGNFALAFSALAKEQQALGFESEAASADKRAESLAKGLPPQERYLIDAHHFQIANDTKRALEAYENLAKASPNNAALQFELGGLYEASGALAQAQDHFAKVVTLDPKYVEGLLALGRVEIKRSNAQASLEPLSSALGIATRLQNDEARANILQAMGVADKRLDRPDEALKNYNESLDIKRRLGNRKGMASSLSEIAQVQQKIGKPNDAEQSYQDALKLQREIGDKAGMSTTLINLASLLNDTLGHPDQALPLLREALQIRREAGEPAGEAAVLNSLGNVYLAEGNYDDAQTYFERTLEIREKNVVPGDLADTLHNLGETQSKMGHYDQSLKQYERALQLRRDASDKRGAAIESYSMGTIFDYLDRYGAAVKAKEEALQTFRDLKLHDMWLGEILSGYGNSLSLSGRMDDAAKDLDEAMTVGRDLKNASLMAQTARFQAERLYYAGDVTGAAGLADQASRAAMEAQDRALTLLAKVTVAKTTAAAQPTAALAARFGSLADEADTLGLKALGVDCLVSRAETLLKLHDTAGARQQAERAIAQADTSGFRLLLARGRYVKGEVLRQAKDASAASEYAAALRVLNDLKSEDGNQNLLKRADLRAMYADCEKWSRGA